MATELSLTRSHLQNSLKPITKQERRLHAINAFTDTQKQQDTLKNRIDPYVPYGRLGRIRLSLLNLSFGGDIAVFPRAMRKGGHPYSSDPRVEWNPEHDKSKDRIIFIPEDILSRVPEDKKEEVCAYRNFIVDSICSGQPIMAFFLLNDIRSQHGLPRLLKKDYVKCLLTGTPQSSLLPDSFNLETLNLRFWNS